MKKFSLIVVALIILVAGYIALFKQPAKQVDQEPNQPPADTNTNWIKSPKFGLFYPAGFDIIEYYELSPAQEAAGAPETEGAPKFIGTKGNAIISWGGAQSACSMEEAQNSAFQYGVSTEACVKDLHANISMEDVRTPLTQAEVKIFGDFVLKNK